MDILYKFLNYFAGSSNGSTATVAEGHNVPNDVQGLIKDVVACNGLVYGRFVRDSLINNEPIKHIDIWFQSNDNKESFIAKRNLETHEWSICYHTKANGGLTLDLVVSDKYPVNDLDVNLLVWDGKEIFMAPIDHLVDPLLQGATKEGIVYHIKQKCAHVLDDFHKVELNVAKDYFVKLEGSGWTLSNKNTML